MHEDEQRIRELVATWMAATKSGHAQTVLSLMTDDAVFLVPGQPVMTRADFAAAANAEVSGDTPQFDGVSEIEEVKILGDWAFMRTKLTVKLKPPGDSKWMTRTGRTLSVLRKENGKWLLARDANLLVPEMTLATPPVARATMLIRRPVEEVFNAFVDPDVTTKFWFNRSSGRLAQGQMVTWYWDHYGVSGDVFCKEIQTNARIAIEWPTPVEWVFTPRGDKATFVAITASGFTGTDDEKVAQALDSTEGFNLVITACKAFLEHGIDLGLIADKNPDGGGSGN